MTWSDAEDIGIALTEKFPDVDPLTVRFTDLRNHVIGLDDDPSFARRADRLGAADWIAKEHAGELLAGALETARLRRGTPAPRPTA